MTRTRRATAPAPADPTGIDGKVALVTGASKRVGRAIALSLAAAGMDIAFTYHSSEDDAKSLTKAIQLLGRRVFALRVDLARPDSAVRLRRAIEGSTGRLDALVNSASIYDADPDTADQFGRCFDRHLAINARTPLLLIHELAPLLASHHRANDPTSTGRIVNLIDVHVLTQRRKNFVAYNASKAALLDITLSMANQLAPKITVNAIAPGVVAWADSYSPAQRKKYLQRVPLGRAGTPKDAAALALFFVRDAHYVTGQVLAVDGGRSLT